MHVDADSDLTQTGQILGTPSYMPPEQAQSKRSLIGPGSDVYSLRAILYECLTGRAPFRADSVSKTIEQVIHTEATSPRLLNPGIPRDLEPICLKCLQKEAHRRFGTAQLLAEDHVGKKVLVLYFYPGDFTTGCTKQAGIYRDEFAKIVELGGEIVGVSGDEVATHRLYKETFELKHSLLADSKGELAKLVGVPISAAGCVRGAYPARTPILNDNGTTIIRKRRLTVARWTVMVGRDGKVASIRSSVDPLTDCDEVCRIVASTAR